jgi:hypothetical protein
VNEEALAQWGAIGPKRKKKFSCRMEKEDKNKSETTTPTNNMTCAKTR